MRRCSRPVYAQYRPNTRGSSLVPAVNGVGGFKEVLKEIR